jgi:hypothetical protein
MKQYSRKGLGQAIRVNRIYDYIANHYTQMSTYDLKEVLLAVLGVCYDTHFTSDEDEDALMELIYNELQEGRDFDLENEEEQ